MFSRSQALGQLRGAVKLAVDAADVEGLLKIGAPADEYDAETDLITMRLKSLVSPARSDIEGIILDVWRQQFGPFVANRDASDKESIRKHAERLYTEHR